jgi:hypothetical protein
MSDNGYMIWFVATAAMIIAVLTIGTLAAAGLIGHDKSPTRPATDARVSGDRADERTPAEDATAAATAAGARRLETEPTDAGPDVHAARAYANAGRQR